MRKCLIKTCNVKVHDSKFVCNHHWQRLPVKARETISDCIRKYLDEKISLASLHKNVMTVLAEYQGVAAEELESGQVAAVARPCPHCKKMLTLPQGNVSGYEQSSNGSVVIIGGVALPASGMPAIYTRFKSHLCEGLFYALEDARCHNGEPAQPTCGTSHPLRDDARTG